MRGRSKLPEVLDNFVVLEGLDGSGTTTQLRLLDDRMGAAGIPHFCTGEPTAGRIGRLIRDILTRQESAEPQTVALLFAADRSEHLHEPAAGILARLERGELVVSDRYLFSSLAYQSLGCPFEYVRELNRPFPLPRLVLFIDTPVAVSQERLARRQAARPPGGPAFPAEAQELFDGAGIQEEVLRAYERAFALFEPAPMEVHRVDGGASTEEVFENIWKILRGLPILRG
ncbi:MAG: dTMP kinase [Spirochaetales bacterium]|nr:dTMP kinase [Spirochaetales bacterium]